MPPDGYAPQQTPGGAVAEPETDDAAADAAVHKLALQRFEWCVSATTDSRKLQLDDAKFFAGSPDNGWQWETAIRQARIDAGRPCQTINKQRQHVRAITNEQRQNRPQGKVVPVDSKSDPEVAEMLNGVNRHIDAQSDSDTAYDTACEQQVTMGEGYWRLYIDYIDETTFEQDIFVRRIADAHSVYLDTNVQDPAGADAEWGFIIDKLPEDKFKRDHPNAKAIDWNDVGTGETKNWYVSGEKKVVVAEYFYKEYTDEEITDGTNTRTVRKVKVCWTKLSGQEILQKTDWPGKWIPIVMVEGNADWIDGVCHRSGLVRNTKDSQRQYNLWSSVETETILLSPKAPFIGAAGQFEGHTEKWKNANVQNQAYLEYEPQEDQTGRALPPPQRQIPPMVSPGLLEAKRGAADDIKSETGQYDPSLGNNAKSQSGVALQREQQKTEIANFHYIDNLSRSIRHDIRMRLDLIPKVYNAQRIARILGEDGTPDQVMIDPSAPQPVQPVMDNGKEIGKIFNPTIGRYDVTVTVGPSYTTQRQETAAMLVEMTQGATDPVVQAVTRYLATKNMDWSGSQEVAKVYKKLLPPGVIEDEDNPAEMPPEVQAQVQQAMQAVEQEKAAMAEAATQIESEKAELDGAKSELDGIVSEIKQAQAALKAQQEALKHEGDVLTLEKQLALKDIQLAKAGLDQQARELAAGEEQMTAQAEAGKSEIAQLAQGVQSLAEMMQQGFMELSKLVTCERRSELEMDAEGNPIGATSRLVMPEQPTIQ